MNPHERLLTTAEAARVARRTPATIRGWAHRGHLTPFTHDHKGRPLYLEWDVLTAERQTRRRDRTGQSLRPRPS